MSGPRRTFPLATCGHPKLAPSLVAKSDEQKTVPRHIALILAPRNFLLIEFRRLGSDLDKLCAIAAFDCLIQAGGGPPMDIRPDLSIKNYIVMRAVSSFFP